MRHEKRSSFGVSDAIFVRGKFSENGRREGIRTVSVCQNGKGRLGKSYSVGKWNEVLSVSRGIDFRLQCIRIFILGDVHYGIILTLED